MLVSTSTQGVVRKDANDCEVECDRPLSEKHSSSVGGQLCNGRRAPLGKSDDGDGLTAPGFDVKL